MMFSGAKVALFLGADLLVIRRDDRSDIPWPGHWDFPGGGREAGETPTECVLRETWEETSLRLSPADLEWSVSYQRPHGVVWFFAAHLPKARAGDVRLGSEGQEWRTMTPREYCDNPLAVPHFAEQLRIYMSDPNFRRHMSGKPNEKPSAL